MKMTLLRLVLLTAISVPLYGQFWQTDLYKAQELAAAESKSIVLVFQGSDWCAPCIKLDKQIWSDPEFQAYAKDHFVMLKADFPRRKKNALSEEQTKANAALAEKYNQQGFFPLVVLLDPEGSVLGTTGYKQVSVQEYIDILNSLRS
jgi:thioredoxin-related protein